MEIEDFIPVVKYQGLNTAKHITSSISDTGQTSNVPTIAVTTQAGITAAAITAGSTDTCGTITTTGTSSGATILDVTFGYAYAAAPKMVVLTPANAVQECQTLLISFRL